MIQLNHYQLIKFNLVQQRLTKIIFVILKIIWCIFWKRPKYKKSNNKDSRSSFLWMFNRNTFIIWINFNDWLCIIFLFIDQWNNVSPQIETEGNRQPFFYGAKITNELQFQHWIINIGNYSFANNYLPVSIILPDCVTSIGDYTYLNAAHYHQ